MIPFEQAVAKIRVAAEVHRDKNGISELELCDNHECKESQPQILASDSRASGSILLPGLYVHGCMPDAGQSLLGASPWVGCRAFCMKQV